MMRTHRYILPLATALLALGACVLGDEPVSESPYDYAYFTVPEAVQVADGLTPVSVFVHGEIGSTLTVHISNAEFLAGESAEPTREKTVHLTDTGQDEFGFAELEIVSTTPGLAQLSFTLTPLAASAEVEFAAVQLHSSAPIPISLRPGAVIHEFCVYANTFRGTVQATTQDGSLSPTRSGLQSIGDSECPQLSADWTGATLFQWNSAEANALVDLDYLGAQDQVLLRTSAKLDGLSFPGYRSQLEESFVSSQWARIRLQLYYQASSALGEIPAASVALHQLRSVPTGLTLVGSSSGSSTETPETDSQGRITLFFDMPPGEDSISVFATPEGGNTLHIGELVPPLPADN